MRTSLHTISYSGSWGQASLPVEEIIEAQKQIGAGIIVLAKHNRPGLTRMFIGSVAERVVRDASCAVLTVHPSDEMHANRS